MTKIEHLINIMYLKLGTIQDTEVTTSTRN